MSRKLIIYSLVSFIAGIIVAVSFGWGSVGAPSDSLLATDNSSTTVSLMLDYGDGGIKVYKDISVTTGETMLQLLENQSKAATLNFTTKSYAGLGKIVETIGRKTNGEDGKYWQYWVNNQYVPVGAESYVIKPGDVTMWKFIKYKQE